MLTEESFMLNRSSPALGGMSSLGQQQ